MQPSTVGCSVDVDGEEVDVFVVVDVFAVVDDRSSRVVEPSDGGLTVKNEVDVAGEDGFESGLVEIKSFEIVLVDDDDDDDAGDDVEPDAAGSLDVSESNAVSNSEVKVEEEELCVVFAPGRTAGVEVVLAALVVVWLETSIETSPPPQVLMHLR